MMLAFVSSTYAQDDLYYDPSDDYFQEEVVEVEKTAQEERRNTARTSSIDDCSHCYTSRIRRFRNNYRGFNYYDPCYTDAYYYNPAFAGQNVYLVYGSPYSYANNWNRWNSWNNRNSWNSWNSWSRPNTWVTWNSPYYGYNRGFNSYGWANPYTYNNYGGYGSAAYCPPNAYGGVGSYYATSTPGNTNTAPRGVRTSNVSNPTANPRSGSGRSGTDTSGGRVSTRSNTTNTTGATSRTSRSSSSATGTRSSRNSTPSTTTRSSNRSSRFGSMIPSRSRSNSSSTRSSRSNSSYKPSSTRSSSSRSNSSFRSSSSSRSSATRSSSRSTSRGGRNN